MTKKDGPLGLGILPAILPESQREKRAKQAHDRKLAKLAHEYAKKYTLRKLRAMQINNHRDQERYYRSGFEILQERADDFDRMISAAIGIRADAHPSEEDLPW